MPVLTAVLWPIGKNTAVIDYYIVKDFLWNAEGLRFSICFQNISYVMGLNDSLNFDGVSGDGDLKLGKAQTVFYFYDMVLKVALEIIARKLGSEIWDYK